MSKVMPLYRSHKLVRALQITRMERADPLRHDGGAILSFEGHPPITVTDAWLSAHPTSEGGYYVVYEDGYASFSPKAAFEKGYTRVPRIRAREAVITAVVISHADADSGPAGCTISTGGPTPNAHEFDGEWTRQQQPEVGRWLVEFNDGSFEVRDVIVKGAEPAFEPYPIDGDATAYEEAVKKFPVLKYLRYKHLPQSLQVISKPFFDLAIRIVSMPSNDPAEVAAALRKLREAKDCTVASMVP